MKPKSLALLSILATAASVHSQDSLSVDTAVNTANPVVARAARTTIEQSLEVPAFTPPPPPVENKVPQMRVDAAVTVPSKGNHTLTVIRGEASSLPDVPPPQESKTETRQPLTPEQIAKLKNRWSHTLQFGATLYDHGTSRVHWQNPDTGEQYEAICGFDISLLQGLSKFTHDGENYDLMPSPFAFETAKPSPRSKRPAQDIPAVAPGSITILKGNPNDPAGTATINLLKDLITSEKTRLTNYQADRLRYQKAAAEWEKSHPPVLRDETVWLRPHRGSQYLADQTSEKGAAQ